MRIWFVVCILLYCPFYLCAQSANKKADAAYQQALSLFRQKNYDGAHVALDKAAGVDNAFPELYLLRADIYNQEKNTAGEIEAIRQAFALDSNRYTSYYYLLADCYYREGDYGNALVFFNLYSRKDKNQKWLTDVKRKLTNCEFALHALATQQKQPVIPYICSDKDVYWPSLDATGNVVLYTCQDGGEENIRMRKDSVDLSLNINTKDNEGTQSLTADGQMMYFTACGRPGGHGSCDIYVSYRISDTIWSEPVNLGYPINTDAWDAQPAISADGTRLFFASNREGGRGGSDIWFSCLVRREPDGRQIWSNPKCLYFNTPGQEMAPFLYYDNVTLFFASDSYPGMGGMDIYKVDLGEVGGPVNVGITVNTPKDEMGFAVDASGQWGYFASDINGPKNIFKYRLEDSIACEPIYCIELQLEDFQGYPLVPDNLVVVAAETGDTLALYDGLVGGSRMLACVPAHRNLLISAVKKGYMYYSDTLRIHPAETEQAFSKKIGMQQIEPGYSLVLKGIFFDVDDYHLKDESVPELHQLITFLKLNPGVKIEISGHTDDTGTAGHNYILSENRAFEVYKYLFVNRISKDRMSYKGYGKDKPVCPNDTEANRAQNRRTEIKILEK